MLAINIFAKCRLHGATMHAVGKMKICESRNRLRRNRHLCQNKSKLVPHFGECNMHKKYVCSAGKPYQDVFSLQFCLYTVHCAFLQGFHYFFFWCSRCFHNMFVYLLVFSSFWLLDSHCVTAEN